MLAYRINVPEKSRPLSARPKEDDLHPEDAINYRARTFPVTTQPEVDETPDTPQPDIGPAGPQENQMTAKKKKAAVRTRPGANGAIGVIDTIIETISKEKGGSIAEIVAVLTKRFPDRDPDGMTKTARIQANKHANHKDRDENRGLVYYRRRR